MNYFLIADLTEHKYNIYHLRKDEDFYHDLVSLIKHRTGHDVVGRLQSDPMLNESVLGVEEKDEILFEPYWSELRAKYMSNK